MVLNRISASKFLTFYSAALSFADADCASATFTVIDCSETEWCLRSANQRLAVT